MNFIMSRLYEFHHGALLSRVLCSCSREDVYYILVAYKISSSKDSACLLFMVVSAP